MFVYEALYPLGIRNTPDISDQSKRVGNENKIKENELVAIDLCEPSKHEGRKNGPFLRLANYEGGWLFEFKNGIRMMKPLQTVPGLWAFKVVNEPGIALRRHPVDEGAHVSPKVLYPLNYILFTDLKVVNGDGIAFYRVQGTLGWVFTHRLNTNKEKDIMMEMVALNEAFELEKCAHVPTVGAKDLPLDIDKIRGLGKKHGLIEVQLNRISRILAFHKVNGPGCEEGPVRINVYYTTGTVGTALAHPTQGRTQLFRRNCTLEDISTIMQLPRWHSGKGYKRRRENNDSVTSVKPQINSDGESEALRKSLYDLENDIKTLLQYRNDTKARLMELERQRHAEALRIMKEKELAQQKLVEESRLAQQKLSEQKRGECFDYSMFHSKDIRLTDDIRLVAMGGECTLVLTMNNSFGYTTGLTHRVYQLLHTRSPRHPKPIIVALGSDDRFYIEFSNGEAEWSADICDNLRETFRSKRILSVSFGSTFYTYVVKYSGGWEWAGDIPKRLDAHLNSNRPIHRVSLGPNGEWFIAFKNGVTEGGGWTGSLSRSMNQRRRNGECVRDLVFGDHDTYIMRYSDYKGPF